MISQTKISLWMQRELFAKNPGSTFLARITSLIVLISSVTGCSSFSSIHDSMKYNGSWNNFMVGYRNTAMSASAWHSRKHTFCREKHLSDFCHGFREGYEAVAKGADGCTPALTPQKYWSWQYQNAEGQAKAAAWFAGYPHGARAAEEEGIGSWSQIQTSAGIQAEYAQAGLLNGQQAGIYPMAAPSQSYTVQSTIQNGNQYGTASNPPSILTSKNNPGYTTSDNSQGDIYGGQVAPVPYNQSTPPTQW